MPAPKVPEEFKRTKAVQAQVTAAEKASIQQEVERARKEALANNIKPPTESDVSRELLLIGLGKVTRIRKPTNQFRVLPRIHGVCCGSPEALMEALDNADETELTDTTALALATEHSWIGIAEGWSMRDNQYPDSISEGDELLMVPLDEWKQDIVPGTAVLSYIRLRDGSEGCSLKEHLGQRLAARNPDYDEIDFGFDGDVIFGQALAICVYRLGRRMV